MRDEIALAEIVAVFDKWDVRVHLLYANQEAFDNKQPHIELEYTDENNVTHELEHFYEGRITSWNIIRPFK